MYEYNNIDPKTIYSILKIECVSFIIIFITKNNIFLSFVLVIFFSFSFLSFLLFLSHFTVQYFYTTIYTRKISRDTLRRCQHYRCRRRTVMFFFFNSSFLKNFLYFLIFFSPLYAIVFYYMSLPWHIISQENLCTLLIPQWVDSFVVCRLFFFFSPRLTLTIHIFLLQHSP